MMVASREQGDHHNKLHEMVNQVSLHDSEGLALSCGLAADGGGDALPPRQLPSVSPLLF